MVLSLKIFIALVFVLTGGAVFTDWGRRHSALAIAAAIVALIGSYYLGRSIYDDLKRDVSRELSQPTKQDRVTDSIGTNSDVLAPSVAATAVGISLGSEKQGWRYAVNQESQTNGVVTYRSQRFTPDLIFNKNNISSIQVWHVPQSDWFVVVGIDRDGQHESFYADTKTKTSVFSKDTVSAGVYWSPQRRFIVSLNSYEGMWLGVVDTKLRLYTNGKLLANGKNPLFVEGQPVWPPHEQYFLLQATERADPWSTTANAGQNMDTHLLRVDTSSLKYSIANSTSPMLK